MRSGSGSGSGSGREYIILKAIPPSVPAHAKRLSLPAGPRRRWASGISAPGTAANSRTALAITWGEERCRGRVLTAGRWARVAGQDSWGAAVSVACGRAARPLERFGNRYLSLQPIRSRGGPPTSVYRDSDNHAAARPAASALGSPVPLTRTQRRVRERAVHEPPSGAARQPPQEPSSSSRCRLGRTGPSKAPCRRHIADNHPRPTHSDTQRAPCSPS